MQQTATSMRKGYSGRAGFGWRHGASLDAIDVPALLVWNACNDLFSRQDRKAEGIMAGMHEGITRELLQTAPVDGLPDWETRLFLITYPPGADGSGHSHPVVGLGLVLEGTMVSAFDDDPEKVFTGGQSFQDRASLHRVIRNGSQTEPMRFVIAYTVRRGEPNTTFPQS